ncbi:MAG: tetratricopeptide repeat protein [Planctomycetota bacterium]|jgi:outer membrane protein assembly factor BamD (BamD/ComL family)
MKLVILALAVLLVALSTASAGISADSEEKLLSEVAEAQELVNTGQTKAARRAYNAVKKGYPEIAGTDFEIFIDAEIYYCRAKITKAVRNYDKLLKEYPQSKFTDAALNREFAIATAYLAGKKKVILGFIRIKGYAEGIRIMEKIAGRGYQNYGKNCRTGRS